MKYLVSFTKEMEYEVIVEAPTREALDIWSKDMADSFDDWMYAPDYEVTTYVADAAEHRKIETRLDEEGQEIYGG